MKTKKFIPIFSLVLLAMMSAFLLSCKKESKDDPQTPTPYVPTFSATSIAIDATTIDFYITCLTDDYELIKVEVKSPGALQDATYLGNGMLLIKGEPITFPNYFVRTSGNWIFIVTGTIKSGVNIGKSFTATSTVSVGGK